MGGGYAPRARHTSRQASILTTFRDLGVHPGIADALERAGIVEPFPIQEMTLEVALAGTDLIGQARTGTGKTLAFGIPLIQRATPSTDPAYAEKVAVGKPQALVVAPTRELALQVHGDLTLASKDVGHRVLSIYGGTPFEPQLEALERGVEIVVGTPGRLLDLANRKALDLSHVRTLVLDEADEMLDLGFLPDVERLLALTPRSRQTMLFSATMPSAIVTLARTHMRQAMNIRAESVTDNQTVPKTTQFVYQAHDLDKPEMIGRLLQSPDSAKTIVFTRTKRQAQRVADDLADRGFPASPLHGDMAQAAREKALKRFRDNELRVLVATDVAARGIDVEGVSHVVNYTCPEDDKTYVHRIGRTGRAGRTGVAITLVDWADVHRWKMINKALDLPFTEPVETYSSSENFLADHQIPEGTKGRIKAPTPKPRDDSGRSGGRSGGASGGSGGSRNRSRSRTRTRGGQPAEGASNGPATTDGSGEAAAGSSEGGTSRNRNRRRRRSRGGKPAEASQASASES